MGLIMMSLMITLNINGLNAITKNTEKLIGFIKKKKPDPSICSLQETDFRAKDTNTLKLKFILYKQK